MYGLPVQRTDTALGEKVWRYTIAKYYNTLHTYIAKLSMLVTQQASCCQAYAVCTDGWFHAYTKILDRWVLHRLLLLVEGASANTCFVGSLMHYEFCKAVHIEHMAVGLQVCIHVYGSGVGLQCMHRPGNARKACR